jgi:hypothetical protein
VLRQLCVTATIPGRPCHDELTGLTGPLRLPTPLVARFFGGRLAQTSPEPASSAPRVPIGHFTSVVRILARAATRRQASPDQHTPQRLTDVLAQPVPAPACRFPRQRSNRSEHAIPTAPFMPLFKVITSCPCPPSPTIFPTAGKPHALPCFPLFSVC